MQEIDTTDYDYTDEAFVLKTLSEQIRSDMMRYERKLDAEEEVDEN